MNNIQKPGRDLRGIDRLNIGCGRDLIPGWLNIALVSGESPPRGSLTKKDQALFLNHDLTEELPLPQDSIKFIYSSHFIEHLNFQEGLEFLTRSHGILQKDGIIRLTFPDLALWAKKYCEGDQEFFKKYRAMTTKARFAKTNGETFMAQVHGWGHKWNYDHESMRDILSRAGFKQIWERKHHDSLIPEIEKIEPSLPLRLLETAYMEARKT